MFQSLLMYDIHAILIENDISSLNHLSAHSFSKLLSFLPSYIWCPLYTLPKEST